MREGKREDDVGLHFSRKEHNKCLCGGLDGQYLFYFLEINTIRRRRKVESINGDHFLMANFIFGLLI